MAKYVAKYACQYGGRVFKPNEPLNYNKEEVVCPDCKGEKKEIVCKLCKDSGRIDPPHHFKLIGESLQVKEKEEKKEEEKVEKVLTESKQAEEIVRSVSATVDSLQTDMQDKKEIKKLRDEITRLGGSYSSRWDVERLKSELIVTQKKYGEKNVVEPKPEVSV